MDTKSIVLGGVGGQGIILASEIISHALFLTGFDVKKNEIHGMSQRGGSVISFIRFGDKVYSPSVEEGKAECVFAFEKVEAMRNLKYLKKDGYAIVSDTEIEPIPVTLGNMEYPDNFDSAIKSKTSNLVLVDAVPIAKEVGNIKTVNVIMIGVLSNFIPEVEIKTWETAIKKMVKEKFIDINLTAFHKGREIK